MPVSSETFLNRIFPDVVSNVEQGFFLTYDVVVVAGLPGEVTDFALQPITGKKLEPSRKLRKGDALADLDEDMDVVGHHAVGMEGGGELGRSFLKGSDANCRKEVIGEQASPQSGDEYKVCGEWASVVEVLEPR